MLWRKQFVVMLAMVMLVSSLWPAVTNASVALGTPTKLELDSKTARAGDDVAIKLEQAISMARKQFPELKWLDEAGFVSSFIDGDNAPRWQLNWSRNERNGASITVSAVNGRIVAFSLWEQEEAGNLAPLPKLSEAEALAKAEKFLQRLAPAELAECRYQAGDPLRPYLRERNWRLAYEFSFQRFANDIPFNFNGLRVIVDADSGAVIGYNYIWTEGTVPTTEQVIGADKAATIAQEAGEMELQYYLPYAKRGETAKPILVYQAPKLNYLAIDALTGEVYTQSLYDARGSNLELAGKAAVADELSPAELKEVTLIEGLLTQDQAVAKARQIFVISKAYELQNARLTTSWQYPEQRHWDLSFTDTADERGRNYITVTLDAKTGEIYRYYTTAPQNNNDSKGILSWESAEKLARAYLAEMNPDKAKQVELVTRKGDQPEEKQLSYYFSYRRLVNGIPFPQNGFEVVIFAGEEPKVTSYSLNWVDATFPSEQGSLSLEQAHAKLRQTYPFHLEYRAPERNVRPLPLEKATVDQKSPITLVYTQAPVPNVMFSAKDMQPLDYQGAPIKETDRTVPTDISGHPAEEEITFLAKVGILPVPASGKYQPNAAATIGDWLQLLANATGNNFEQLVERLGKGKQIDQTQPLRREEMALYAIRALGYDKVAAMSNIFRLTAPDADKVSKEYTGYVAIALELKLLQLQEKNVAPQAVATKGDLAATLMQMLKLER